MKKFIVIYRASTSWMEKMKNTSPEDRKKGMEPWMAWANKCGSGLFDWGAPLGNGQMVTKHGSTPSKNDIVGYSILQAENMKKALEMLKEHPHLTWADGCEIEVYEAMPTPQ